MKKELTMKKGERKWLNLHLSNDTEVSNFTSICMCLQKNLCCENLKQRSIDSKENSDVKNILSSYNFLQKEIGSGLYGATADLGADTENKIHLDMLWQKIRVLKERSGIGWLWGCQKDRHVCYLDWFSPGTI